MCAIPFPCKSILRTVVGFVLAAILLKVRGSEVYEVEEREGDGEGGALGGNGRTDASSSAYMALAGDHVDSRAMDDPSTDLSSSSDPLKSSSPLRDTVLRRESARASSFACCLPPLTTGEGSGDDTTRFVARKGIEVPRPFAADCCEVGDSPRLGEGFTVPPSLRWNQLRSGLLDRRCTFFCGSCNVALGCGVGFVCFGCFAWVAGREAEEFWVSPFAADFAVAEPLGSGTGSVTIRGGALGVELAGAIQERVCRDLLN